MSTLIVLDNLNHFTFANSIVPANSRAIEFFYEPLTDIFVMLIAELLNLQAIPETARKRR